MKRIGVLVLVTAACSTNAVGAGQTQGATGADATIGADATADAGGADAPICNVKPTLKSFEAEYFTSCTFSTCHSTKKQAGGLDLSPGKAWAQLVNVPAFETKAKAAKLIRVVPGNPEASFLYEKVHGPTTFGALMPEGAYGPVDPDCGIAALRAWIVAGALDN